MKSRKAIVLTLILVVFTGIMVFIHLNTRDNVTEGTIQILFENETYSLDISKLDYEQVTGTRVNGKGKEYTVDAPGILLKNILEEEGINEYSTVTVSSDDSYSAELTAEEVNEASKAYLICEEEGELRLIVFGDENSKRSVSNVVQIVVE